MGEEFVLNAALSVISLLFIATLVTFLLRNSRVPYTVVLVLVGLGLGFFVEATGFMEFLGDFRLSPDLVFYIFLPTLIFESAFHTNFKHFQQSKWPILGLSTVGMLISTGLIATGMHYLVDFDWGTSLLFGALISATDPISVLALFKKIGAPKRLSTIVEGESLFNDGVALVLFGLFLEGKLGFFESFGDISLVIFGGLATGLIMGLLFSKALDYVKNSKEIEISITLVLAHATFIIAEYFLGVSGILATVAAGLVIGNYGLYKISPGVKEIMTHFWDYTSFLANSLLFLMVGLIIHSTNDSIAPLAIPLLLVIGITVLARMIMVYTVLPITNLLFPREKIPTSWIHMIQWSGLRGALAIALILTLPDDFAFYEELLIFTVGVIFFTIIFNGFTIGPLLSMFKLKDLSVMEKFEHEENKVLIDKKVRKKLKEMRGKGFISKKIHGEVTAEYGRHSEDCNMHIHRLFEENKKELNHELLMLILKRHLLGIEKRTFTKLYYYGEITQELLHILLANVNRQMESLESKEKVEVGRLTTLNPRGFLVRNLSKLGFKSLKLQIKRKETMLRYEMYRAREIGSADVLDALDEIRECNVYLDKSVISEFEKRYKTWQKKARQKLKSLERKDPSACKAIQRFLAQQAAFHVEEKALKELGEAGIASTKVYNKLKVELAERREALDL